MSRAHPTLADLPAKYQAQAQAQLNDAIEELSKYSFGLDPLGGPPVKRVKQSSAKPNKLEADLGAWLRLGNPKYNAVTFRIANGLRYTPDWVLFKPGTKQLQAYEVKGPFAYAGSLEKLKMAASAFPEVNFILAWRDKSLTWQFQNILS